MTQTINQMRALKSSRISEKNEMMNAIEAKPSMKFEDRVGFVGLVIVQGALLPSHFSGSFPHWSLPLGVCCGLLCYQYRAWVQRDMVYTIGNITGLSLNGLMLIRIMVGA
jgi:hypothetical protein|tara:strand:+ start:237 stop:566 length:330 start_codon:yes stop_codon:yes gene_type:complete